MAAQQPNTSLNNLDLCNVIAQRITESPQQRITFAEYMDLVLYHPEHGYYANQNLAKIGAQGDFFTSPHLGNDFGELLAEQFAEMWQILGQPQAFTLVEMGAGQGILAGDILKYLQHHYPELCDRLQYWIVEKSTALRAEQQQRLHNLPVQWCELNDIPAESVTGCLFSNELVDAFPVHQIAIEDEQLREVYVTLNSQGEPDQPTPFKEVTGIPSTPRLAEYFQQIELKLPSEAYPEGYRTEVNLAALDWMATVAERLHRGYLLTIDYGYPATRYYTPARYQGTLQCYYQHGHHSDPYVCIGHQDITAHVDFTALEQQGNQCRLAKLGFTQQGLFLMALGLNERIAALSTQEVVGSAGLQQLLHRREALHSLMNPMGLGNFGVLVQSKRLTEAEKGRSLKGLRLPE